jgi:type 1 glutamine amidotransferase
MLHAKRYLGRMCRPALLAGAVAVLGAVAAASAGTALSPYVVYQGSTGPGVGKHIVFIAGDEEYRSEESLPMLGKIMAMRYGFKCTVLFSQDSATGYINPNNQNYIPGLANLETADLMVILTRFRQLPDKDMKYFVDYVNSGKPMIGLRTATHAFWYQSNRNSPYVKYDFYGNSTYPGGFGRQVLGETWIDHYGGHGSQSTLGVIRDAKKTHPIFKGVTEVWGPTDAYKVTTLNGDADILMDAQVLTGMKETDPPLTSKPLMPVAWVKTYTGDNGKKARVFTTTMGASVDFENEGMRRMFVNACFWSMAMESSIPDKANVDYVTPFKATMFGNDIFKKSVKPQDLALPPTGLRYTRGGDRDRIGGIAGAASRPAEVLINAKGQWLERPPASMPVYSGWAP